METVNKTNRVLVFIFLTAMVLFSTLFIFLYKWITHPLSTLYNGMAAVEKGDFTIKLEGHHIDEVDYIYLKFNAMASRIRRLLDEVRLENLRSQEAEFKFLQAQINPHFLYNNLFFIYQMSMRNENKKSGEMAIALSSYFKDVTRPKTSLVTLETELENLNNYLKIFSLRYPDRFKYNENIDDELKQVSVPRLVLQPFVENSIVYGLENTDEPLFITINGEIRKDMIIIVISDNGTGIENTKRKELNYNLKNTPGKLEGCGLKNPLQRLKYRFGNRASIQLEAVKPKGLKVLIKFPVKLKNIEEEAK